MNRPEKITFGEMREFGARGIMLLCLVLSACSSDNVDLPAATYVPPSPPTQAAVISGVKAATSEAKLTAPMEISAVRPADRGPGHYFLCLREASPTSERRRVYSVFYDNDVYKGSRQSVIMDACEAQAFIPVDLTPPTPPPKPGHVAKRSPLSR
jgi:hypothetical protein